MNAGYVGTVLTEELIKKGYEVTVLDLMIYGEEVLKKDKNLTIIKGDIRDQSLLKNYAKPRNCNSSGMHF